MEDLRDTLSFLGCDNVENDILSSMMETAAAFGMKPSDIGDSWSAYSLNHGQAELNFDNWMNLKKEMNQKMVRSRKRPSAALANSSSTNVAAPGTPSGQVATKTPLKAIHPSLFEKTEAAELCSPMSNDPAAVGSTVFQYCKQGLEEGNQALLIDEKWWGSENKPGTVSADILVNIPKPFNYMLQKPSDIILSLNDHLEWLEREAFNTVKEEAVEVTPGKEMTTLVGRLVVSNAVNDEGNGSGVNLQSSLTNGSGIETPLSVVPNAINGFSICQGQVVSVTGRPAETSKRLFLVEKVQLPFFPSPHRSLSPAKGNDFLALIAAGPFTNAKGTAVNLAGLASVVQRFQPPVVFLVGPFGATGMYQALCRDLAGVKSSSTTFCIIPAHSDINSGSPPVYPTKPVEVDASFENKEIQIICPPDPAFLDINGGAICATSVDVLKNLASLELHLGAPVSGGGDRLARLASSIIYQRSMYPLYPHAPSVPCDWPLWRKMSTLPCMPHLLIVPSDLNPFISSFMPCKDTLEKPSVCPLLLNPGRVSRRRAALVRWSAKEECFSAGRIVRV